MIFTIQFSCQEGDPDFVRVFEADSDATFLDLHKAILASVKYEEGQMTSFFLCDAEWNREQEITLLPMGDDSFEYENSVMEETYLGDLLTERGQRLVFIFDPMLDREFYGTIKDIKAGSMQGVECVTKKGRAPKQIGDIEPLMNGISNEDLDMDFRSNVLDINELDMEDGYQNLSFDDNTMF